MAFQLHVSGLNTLSKCGIQFERRYLMGERIPPGWAALVGTAVDRSVRKNLQNIIDTGAPISDAEAMDVARDTLVEEWERGDGVFQPEEDETRDAGIDAAVDLSALHHREVAPEIKPIRVARTFVLDLKGFDIQLAGEIDIDEARRIRDTKTSKKSPSKDQAHQSLQMTTYSLARLVLDGSLPEEVSLDYLVRLKTPKSLTVSATPEKEHFNELFARIEAAHVAMTKGAFIPAPLDAWWCSAKWCGFHSTCRYARKPMMVTAGATLESEIKNTLIQIQQKAG